MIPPHIFQTEAWRLIAAHLDAEIEALRLRNDSDLSEKDTASVRGELKFAKRLRALSVLKPPIQPKVLDPYDGT